MGACTTLSALATQPEITASLACTIATTAQPKRAAIRTVTITHRAHASASHVRWHRRVNVGPLSGLRCVYDALRARHT